MSFTPGSATFCRQVRTDGWMANTATTRPVCPACLPACLPACPALPALPCPACLQQHALSDCLSLFCLSACLSACDWGHAGAQ
eukprot:COSAG02_NODE_2587_length_8475_cov_39.760506_2_plen_83_part_00